MVYTNGIRGQEGREGLAVGDSRAIAEIENA